MTRTRKVMSLRNGRRRYDGETSEGVFDCAKSFGRKYHCVMGPGFDAIKE